MMRSLSSGVAGLRTHQTKMDVIGNNIANVNTYGFKASRTTFADVYYQNLAGASAGTAGGIQGGRNATQIGYGSSVATIDVQNSVAGAATTDFAMDVYIQGDGFIVSKDQSGRTSYTRLGKLDFDSAGNLVDGNGNVIQGFPMGDDGKPIIGADGRIDASDLRAITGDPELLHKLTGITISPTGLIVGTLEGDKTLTAANSLPAGLVKDSFSINPESNYEGNVHLAVGALPRNTDIANALNGVPSSGKFSVTNTNFGDVGLPSGASYTMTLDGTKITLKVTDPLDKNNDNVYEGTVGEDGSVTLKSKNNNKVAMTFDVYPKPDSADNNSSSPAGNLNTAMIDIKYQATVADKGGNVNKLPEAEPGIIGPGGTLPSGKGTFDGLNGITIGYDFSAISPANPFKSFSMNVASAKPGDDVLYPIGNLALAKFPNPNGMKEDGSSYFSQTANSGEPEFVRPGVDGTGALKAGYLEMSNVDVSKEFTDMITTQRGFQANSRIITVSDTMLEELVNLKR